MPPPAPVPMMITSYAVHLSSSSVGLRGLGTATGACSVAVIGLVMSSSDLPSALIPIASSTIPPVTMIAPPIT